MEQSIQLQVKQDSIWKNKQFIYLLASSVFSSLGASMFLFTQSWYIVTILNLQAAVGFVMIGSTLPQIFLLFIGGVIADRWDKTRLMFWSDLTRVILIFSLVIVLVAYSVIPIFIFVIYAVAFGVLGAFFYPARDSIIPMITEDHNLTKANSLIQGTNQLSMLAGPLVCGVLITLFNFQTTFFIVAILLAAGTLPLYFMRESKVEKERVEGTPLKKELMEGLLYIKGSSLLQGLLLISVLINLIIVGPLFMGLPIFVRNVLDGTALSYSLIEGSLSIGLLIGSIIMFAWNTNRHRGKIALYSLLCLAFSYLLFSQTTTFTTGLASIFLVGGFIQITTLPVISIIQRQVSKEYLGRIMSLMTISSMGLTPISYGVTSMLLTVGLTIQDIMFWSSLILIVVTIVVLLSARKIRATH
ncbi:DHA3 family macrolide efflux protein-like MFS transporter [Rossellomorea marisflavi]